MTFTADVLQAAHKHCAANRTEVEASKICGCFYCGAIYPPSEVEEWLEETTGELALRPDPRTAICPRCMIDSVIGSASGFPSGDSAFLNAMKLKWFG